MGNNKKTRLVTRIIAGLLVLVMALGFIIPYVSASEIEDTQTEETTEATDAVVEEEEVIVTTPSVSEDQAPGALPDGLYYEKVNGNWVVKVRETANVIPVQITNIPAEYDAEELVLFVANLETKEVQTISLKKHYNFVGTMNMKPGYYAFYANDIAWGNGYDVYYTFNDGDFQYFRLGSTTVAERDGVKFTDASSGLFTKLTQAGDDYAKVMAGQSILITEQMKQYPSELPVFQKDDGSNGNVPGNNDNNTNEGEGTGEEEEERNSGSIIANLFLDMIKRSVGIIIVIAGCAIAVFIIKKKRENAMWEQTQNDKYDDRRIR